MNIMKKYNYIIYMLFFVLCGVIYGIYDDNQMEQDLKDIIKIEYSKPIIIKKRFVRTYRDGRTRLLNDSFCTVYRLASFDEKFWLDDNWGKVDSLIKGPNTDTLKCILNSGEVINLKVYNPAKDDW